MSKSQISNSKKQITHNNQIQNSRQLTAYPPFEYWDLEFVWSLVLGICFFWLVRPRVVYQD